MSIAYSTTVCIASISSIVMVMTYAVAVTPSDHAIAKPLCLIEQ